MLLFPELKDNTIKNLIRTQESESLAKNFGKIRTDKEFEKYAEKGKKDIGILSYNDEIYRDWGGTPDTKTFALDSVSEDRKKELYAAAGKYGKKF